MSDSRSNAAASSPPTYDIPAPVLTGERRYAAVATEVSPCSRPQGLTAIILATGFWQLFGLCNLVLHTHHFSDIVIIDLVIRITFSIVLLAAWKGYNWARIYVGVAAVLCMVSLIELLNLPHAPHLPHPTFRNQAMLVADAALSAFALYYINTPPVKAFFRLYRASLTVRGGA